MNFTSSFIMTLTCIFITSVNVQKGDAAELIHQFKSPSFSGVGASAHWMTIENQEATRSKNIQDKIDAALKQAATEERNSILNRFMNNLQSRIYSQIAQQLSQNLFSSGSDSGSFTLDDNTIDYVKTADQIEIKITDASGNTTQITIPTGGFNF